MPTIQRSALVEHAAARMFDLINDIPAYPRRFDWCEAATVLEADDAHMVARLDVALGPLRTWFTTHNTLQRPTRIDMVLRDGPFRRLEGGWQFQALAADACKATLSLDFEPRSVLLLPPLTIGLKALADRMVNDFVRLADREAGD